MDLPYTQTLLESGLVTVRTIRQKEQMRYLERERGLECCRFRLDTYSSKQDILVIKSEDLCRITRLIFSPKNDHDIGLSTVGEYNPTLVVTKQSQPSRKKVKQSTTQLERATRVQGQP